MDSALFIIALVLPLLAFVGGFHTAVRSCRHLASSYDNVLSDVADLRQRYDVVVAENFMLRERFSQLESDYREQLYRLQVKYDEALQEIAKLSGELHEYKNSSG